MRTLFAVLLLALCAAPALAARSEQARIDALLAAVERSGCNFERNGAVHPAAEGAAHLRAKLESVGDRVQTVVQFIERIATGSSQSGKPYRVLCPDKPPQLARDWLLARLAEMPAAGR